MAVAPAGDSDLVAEIDVWHAQISAGQRRLLGTIAMCDRSGRWEADGSRNMASWLAGRLGISNWAARRWVVAAHALERLPRLSDALSDGALCLDKVLELARFATPETETRLISWAHRVSAAAVRRKAELARRATLEDIREAERTRFVRWWYFDEGRRMGIEGELPAAQGAAIAAAIARVADQLPELPDDDPGFGDASEDRRDGRRADALYVLASQTIATDADPDRATVVVHTTVDQGRPGHEIEGGPVIHSEIARRLSCDARLQFVLSDRAGNALGIGRASRGVPAWLMRQLRYRDRGCSFPGCGTKTFLQAHHIRHWEDGGATDLDNLVLTCCFHHKLVHEWGWGVELAGGMAQWVRPDGRRFEPGPGPGPPRAVAA